MPAATKLPWLCAEEGRVLIAWSANKAVDSMVLRLLRSGLPRRRQAWHGDMLSNHLTRTVPATGDKECDNGCIRIERGSVRCVAVLVVGGPGAGCAGVGGLLPSGSSVYRC